MVNDIIVELEKMQKGLKRTEKEIVSPLANNIILILKRNSNPDMEVIHSITELLGVLSSSSESVKVQRGIIKILCIIINYVMSSKTSKAGTALVIFINSLLSKIGSDI